MIQIRVLGDEIGIGITENGNAGISAIDKRANIIVQIEMTPEAWKRFIESAPRLKGVGIAVPSGNIHVVEYGGNGGG